MKLFNKRKTNEFPFNDSPNTACIVCHHVLDNDPILYVSHDEDGMYQFLCGSNHDVQDARIISLLEAYHLDHTIGLLKDMPIGYCAIREDKESDWIIKKKQ